MLTREHQADPVDELAGDEAYTLAEPAAEIARPSGKNGVYQNLPEADFKAALLSAGLPEPLASLWAESDVGVSTGALFDDGHPLSRLIGRPTTPLATPVKSARQAHS